jgi:4-hydroxy-tetrahydrodipicolinate synthase
VAKPVFLGVGVALISVFDNGGRLDARASAGLADRLVGLGVRAVIVAGSTGEARALSDEERAELLVAVREAVPIDSGIPVIAGTGADSAQEAAELTRRADECGADGSLVLSPPGSHNLSAYYERVVRAAGPKPVLAYHYPAASSPGIGVDQLASLPIEGLKDSSGDPERLLLTRFCWDAPLYTGSSALLTMAGQVGCAGAILASANAMPELCVAAFAGDGDAQVRLIESHLAANRDFPSHIKALTAERFGTSAVSRVGR